MNGKMQRREFQFNENVNSSDIQLRQYVCDYRRIWEDVN